MYPLPPRVPASPRLRLERPLPHRKTYSAAPI